MNYKTMIETAQKEGVANESVMWSSVSRIDGVLDVLKEEHPDLYWKLLRDTHEELYGCHYNEDFAKYDVSQMHSTDKDGHTHDGAYWTLDDVLSATKNKEFDKEVTDWDKYVAYNACANDFCRSFDDEDILEIAYLFFFDDEDACEGKVWKYVRAMCC